MEKYTMMNLSFISRLAVLEHADRTRDAIDDLVKILRYLEEPGAKIKTVVAEMKIIDKMCRIQEMKKGKAYHCLINNALHEDRCYIPAGIMANALRLTMDKEIVEGRESVEVILSVKASEEGVCIIIKDNGDTRGYVSGPIYEASYGLFKATYEAGVKSLDLEIKPGIGTKVIVQI